MNKILTSYNCDCGCNKLPSNILKITAGNDFSIELQLTEKVGDEWVHYDMSDMTDVIVSVVSPNGTPTELHSIVDISTGNITAIVDAQQFSSYVIYGIEVLWRDDEEDKRAYAPHVFAFVNSSMEATDSAYRYTSYNPYEYNIQMVNDMAVISIGRIPEIDMTDYYTKEQIDDTLTSYVTYTSLDEMAYATTEYVNYMFDHIPAPDMSYYYTKTDVDTTLESYVQTTHLYDNIYTKSEVDTSLSAKQDTLVSGTNIKTINNESLLGSGNIEVQTLIDLSAYVTHDELSGMSYVTSSDISSMTYVTSSDVDTILNNAGYITSTDLSSAGYVTSGDVDTILNNAGYVTAADLTDAGYVKESDVETMMSNASYVTYAYLEQELNNYTPDMTYYYTKQEIDTTLESYALYTDLDNYNNAIATTLTYHEIAIRNTYSYFSDYYDKTTSDARYITPSQVANNYVDYPALENVTYTTAGVLCSLDDRVTYLEQNGGGGGGGTVPSNVVTSYDATYIYCLSQSDYDTLEQQQQLDEDTFYYITGYTTDYVTQAQLSANAYVTETFLNNQSYATQQYVQDEIAQSGGGSAPSNMVTTDTQQTISGQKTFEGETHFNYDYDLYYTDIFVGVNKSSCFARGSFNQLNTGEIIAPNNAVQDATCNINDEIDKIKFYKTTGNSTQKYPYLTQIAAIDNSGIYEGTTLLANKYVQSSAVRNIVQISQADYNNLATPDANTLYIIT